MLLVFVWFLVCYAATQLATQLQQRCIQVVRSNKEAQKRLTEWNGTPAMDIEHINVVWTHEFVLVETYTYGDIQQTRNRTKQTSITIN